MWLSPAANFLELREDEVHTGAKVRIEPVLQGQVRRTLSPPHVSAMVVSTVQPSLTRKPPAWSADVRSTRAARCLTGQTPNSAFSHPDKARTADEGSHIKAGTPRRIPRPSGSPQNVTSPELHRYFPRDVTSRYKGCRPTRHPPKAGARSVAAPTRGPGPLAPAPARARSGASRRRRSTPSSTAAASRQ